VYLLLVIVLLVSHMLSYPAHGLLIHAQ
jgi:hypothetical protein